MKLRSLLYFFILTISFPSYCQDYSVRDTVKIGEVVISRRNTGQFPVPEGFRKALISTAVMAEYKLGTIADVISLSPSVFIKSYGLGGIATPSFRGAGPGNTGVAWNGILIGHPMLGQNDMSLLPAGMIDNVHLYFGGASMSISSGSSGGMISLNTGPVWKNESEITINSGAGSFGTRSGLVSARTGNESFNSVTKAFLFSAQNDFTFTDRFSESNPVRRTRENSRVVQKGFMQELYFRNKGNSLSARFWYQASERQLPSSMLVSGAGLESQDDESIRTMLDYESKGSTGNNFFATAAWLMNRLNYDNTQPLIMSRNNTGSWILKTGFSRELPREAVLGIRLAEELTGVRSNNYSGDVNRNNANITISIDNVKAGRLTGSFLIREILDRNKLLYPDLSSGLQFSIDERGSYLLKANFSRSSRLPTLNDMYFNPGGNTGLRNEYSYISELDFSMTEQLSSSSDFEFNISAFRNSIRDMIQWHQGEFTWWTADNIRKVNTAGFEVSVSADYRAGRFSSELSGGYSYTRAEEDNEETGDRRQLIYVPLNKADAMFRVRYGKLYSFLRSDLSGRRFTTSDNTKYLPPYFISSISAGINHEPSWGTVDLSIGIDNVLNTEYQAIAYYPLPGRSFMAKILFQFIKRKK